MAIDQKGVRRVALLVALTMFVGAAGYLIFIKKTKPTTQSVSVPTPSSTFLRKEEKQTVWCVNTRFGYQLAFPSDWKVWTSGKGEVKPATCEENLGLYIFAQDIFGTPFKNQINVMVYTRDNQSKKFWQGINSLDEYLQYRTIGKAKKEIIIDSERFVQFEYEKELRLFGYQNSAIYELSIFSVDSTIVDNFLTSFKFIK